MNISRKEYEERIKTAFYRGAWHNLSNEETDIDEAIKITLSVLDRGLSSVNNLRGENMTLTEILNVIHKERVELEIFEALSKWMVEDRSAWIDEAMEQKAIIRAIGKIADENPNRKEAIEGIKNLCSGE